nr:MAG TPA: hypothetical protein [Caudoviricetes sp.]
MKQIKSSKEKVRNIHLPRRSTKECSYSSSCFECPLDDCHAWSGNVVTLNQLPEDMKNEDNR